MPHIHTERGQHDTTASAIIIRLDGPEPQVLLHMHKKYDKLFQPGGHVELNENPWQAVLHELVEETGYQTSQLALLQPRDRMKPLKNMVLHPQGISTNTHLAAPDHYHTDTAYLFVTSEQPSGKPAEGESQDLRWVTYDELIALPEEIIAPGIREICSHVFNVLLKSWTRVELSEYAA